MIASMVIRLKKKASQAIGPKLEAAETGETALNAMRLRHHDLVLMSLMAKGKEAEALMELIRGEFDIRGLDTTLVSGRGTTWDPLVDSPLRLGRVPTPFTEPSFAVARVSGSLNRKPAPLPLRVPMLRIRDLVIHPGRREVFVDSKKIPLTPTEFNVLQYLAKRPGWVFTNKQILEAVRGYDTETKDHSLTVHMTFLRRKLGHAGKYIETVPGVGYRLSAS